MQVFHVRQVQQRALREPGKRVEVGRHHFELEGARARDVVAGDHVGDAPDRFFELARGGSGVAVGVDAHEGEHAQADLAAVDLGPVTGDETLFFEPLDAPPGRRSRQADACGQLGVRQARVALQLVQQGDVVAVEFVAVRLAAGGIGGGGRCRGTGRGFH
ncbi:MAG: hypothetical protein Q8R33_16965 [Burkholderiales bacterium]|nr:hypothetical protein [Burkholderiales bacterium]